MEGFRPRLIQRISLDFKHINQLMAGLNLNLCEFISLVYDAPNMSS